MNSKESSLTPQPTTINLQKIFGHFAQILSSARLNAFLEALVGLSLVGLEKPIRLQDDIFLYREWAKTKSDIVLLYNFSQHGVAALQPLAMLFDLLLDDAAHDLLLPKVQLRHF
jgi:hypothetical protein